MKKIVLVLYALVFVLKAWGFFAHKKINEIAIYTLPPEMLLFFKSHHQEIIKNAVAPDVRRSVVAGEDVKHFIDWDKYCEQGHTFQTIPRQWKDAQQVLDTAFLHHHGIAPWNLVATYKKLVFAFTNKDSAAILKIAADLGHYCGDLHVPLHTTSNYNGQLSGQKGIHGLWESRLPELFAEDYDFFVAPIFYIRNITQLAWQIAEETHEKVPTVLALEKQVTQDFPEDKKYSYEKRGNVTVRVYARDFCAAYQAAMQGMVEEQMRRSMQVLGSLWYSAWIDAGQPDLNNLLVVQDKKAKKIKKAQAQTQQAPVVTPAVIVPQFQEDNDDLMLPAAQSSSVLQLQVDREL